MGERKREVVRSEHVHYALVCSIRTTWMQTRECQGEGRKRRLCRKGLSFVFRGDPEMQSFPLSHPLIAFSMRLQRSQGVCTLGFRFHREEEREREREEGSDTNITLSCHARRGAYPHRSHIHPTTVFDSFSVCTNACTNALYSHVHLQLLTHNYGTIRASKSDEERNEPRSTIIKRLYSRGWPG